MGVYNRLNYNAGAASFNGADQLNSNTANFFSLTSIGLNTWQTNDLANGTVGGYYQNPLANTLASLAIYLNAMSSLANTANVTFTNAPDTANTLASSLSTVATTLFNFTVHTNNLSGVTYSANSAVYPDLNTALAVGRQVLNIVNKTDSIQNNSPMIGSFTSLYIGANLTSSSIAITNDYITLNNSISIVSGNTTSNISNAAMNIIVSDVNTLQTLMNTQMNNDWTFYQNSMNVVKDYQTVSQFSNLGATQNSLISLIGTSKLKSRLGV
jgi:hypothetical protein